MKKVSKPIVGILMGSDSDLPVMREVASVLDEFDVAHEMQILSAHRSPDQTHAYAQSAMKRGVKVVIAGAGGAAHLAGVIASTFVLPVIGVPMGTSALGGVDSLYSTVQMPPGVPVACVGINAAKNAGILAVQILSVSDASLTKKLLEYKKYLAAMVIEKNKKNKLK